MGKIRSVEIVFKGLTANKQWSRELDPVIPEHTPLNNRVAQGPTEESGR